MRSRAFAIAMGVLCAALGVACVVLGLRLWRAREQRGALPRAVKLYDEGNLEAALPYLDQAIAQEPDRVELRHLAAVICLNLHRPDQARERYLALRDRSTGAGRARAELRLGVLALDAEGRPPDFDEAIARLKAARDGFQEAKDQSQAATILLLLADTFARKGDPKAVEACYDQLAALPPAVRGATAVTAVVLHQVAAKVRKGDTAGLIEAWNTLHRQTGPSAAEARQAIALVLGLRAGDPTLSSDARQACLTAVQDIASEAYAKHELRLHLTSAAAWALLGDASRALEETRKARDMAPGDPALLRAYAGAFAAAAAKANDPTAQQQLREDSLKAWQDVLAAGKPTAEERRQLTLALASIEWNRDRRDAARQLLRQHLGSAESPLVERMEAIAALDKRDHEAAVKHLRRIVELEGVSPQAAELLKQLTAPPEILDLRVSRVHCYDARPIVIAAFAPKAAGALIAPDKVAMSLDGQSVSPVVTRAECFFRPDKELAPGDHKIEVAVTDSLGLKATRAFPFSVDADKEPPTLVGISPAPEAQINDLTPLVAFRCTDPSGIDSASITVTFGAAADAPRRRDATIVNDGAYQVDINGSSVKIAKGTGVEHGVVRFQPSKPLAPGKYRVQVRVADTRGNKCAKDWTFECTQ